MQLKRFFAAAALTIAACNEHSNMERKETGREQTPGNEAQTNSLADSAEVLKKEQKSSNGFWEKMVMNELKDANGMVAAVIPFPSSWKVMQVNNNGGPSITGPNGIKPCAEFYV